MSSKLLFTVLQRAMASSSNKGAAEEPEPEPGPPSTSSSASPAAAATYDPREYQPAHPDDRGGDGKPAKKGKATCVARGGGEVTFAPNRMLHPMYDMSMDSP